MRSSVWMLAALAWIPLALAGAGNSFDQGYRLAEQKGCLDCHALGRAEVGPSFRSIALRYRHNPERRDELPYIIRGGSAGHWGERFVMWPQPRLSDQEVKELVDWVLSQ